MSPGGRRRPWFSLKATKSRALEERGASPWTFEAVTILRFVAGKDRSRLSVPLSFRLDTGAFASLLPEAWVRDKGLQRFLGKLSAPLSFTTAAGSGRGRLARAVPVQFPMDPAGVYPFDFVVTPNLDGREYGLIALRDLIWHFEVATEGKWEVAADGTPLSIPDLMLIPRER